MNLSLPDRLQLKELLALDPSIDLNDLLASALISPLEEFFQRPRKDIRGEMVRIAYQIICNRKKLHTEMECEDRSQVCLILAEVLEFLHAGSLLVDDIQDGSLIRRGALAMHRLLGLPLALNAGNWLYFWPLQKIQSLPVSAEIRMQLYQECSSTLLRAHFGQALDLGTPILSLPQERIPEVCMATIQLKTGALMSLALKLGAILAEANEPELKAIDRFGHQFGVALQLFDDIGNLTSRKNPEKRFEDLKNLRPGFIWSLAAQVLTLEDFEIFCDLCKRLPESETEISRFLLDFKIADFAKIQAQSYLERSFEELQESLGLTDRELGKLNQLKMELVSSYE